MLLRCSQVLQSINDRAEAATKLLANAPVPDPVSEQPSQIRAMMREYQLQVSFFTWYRLHDTGTS